IQAILHEEFAERVRTTGLSVMNFFTEVTIALSYYISASVVNQLEVKQAWKISCLCFLFGALVTVLGFKKDRRA
ncbi:hypothetical protein COV11_03955, partial [Candidatus Woesearchaeota archaeon CG10_big_fil_rev_8_21_14_0_10_30_7]